MSLPVKPSGVEIYAYELKTPTTLSAYDKVYERSRDFVDSITIHNRSTQELRIAFKKVPSGINYDTIAPRSYYNLDGNPKHIYMKKTVDTAMNPVVVIKIWYWTDEDLNKMRDFIASAIQRALETTKSLAQSAIKTLKMTVPGGGIFGR